MEISDADVQFGGIGHGHFWDRTALRRHFLGGIVGATGLVLGAGTLVPPALADDGGSTVEPLPIPGGDNGTHHFLPGRGKEVSTINNFNGVVGVAQLTGTGTGTNTTTGATTPLTFSVDNRFLVGEFVGADGRHHQGVFGVF